MHSDLAVLTCYFNPCGYENRKLAYRRFAAGLQQQGVELWTIEATLAGQTPFVGVNEHVLHVPLPHTDWLWQKERLLNRLIQLLPRHYTKVAWVDCDLLFDNDNWAHLASQTLDTWPVIQLFDFAYWLGPNDEILLWEGIADRRASLASIVMHYPSIAQDFRIGAPGFAWAARRNVIEPIGLYENDVTGGGDSVIAAAFYNWHDHGFLAIGTKAMNHDCQNYVRAMYDRVRSYVGYIPCSIRHLWHGSYESRAYVERRRQLKQFGYDPFRDLEDDPASGLLCWSQYANNELRDYVQHYFYSRREDAQMTS